MQVNLEDWAAYFGTDTQAAKARVYDREDISTLSKEVRSYLDFAHAHEPMVSEDMH